MALDPHFDKVSLLLHMDGADGSTTIVDSSAAPNTVTAYGNAKISTAQSKFGGSSLYLNGAGAYADIAPSSLFEYPGAFTIEMNVYPLSNDRANLYDNFVGGNSRSTLLYLDAGALIFFYSISEAIATDSGLVLSNQWNHIVIQRGANNLLTIFVNGVASAQVSYGETIGLPNYTVILGYTRWKNGDYFNGYIDDVRITKGVARYTASFTPPTEPFPNSAPPLLFSAYAAAATPLGATAALALHQLAARAAAPTPLGTAQALAEFNGTSKVRASAASMLGQPTAVSKAVMQARAKAATPLGAVQALAYSPPTGKAAAPTPLGAPQVTAYAMVAGYAASTTPLGQPAALAFADTEALGTLGQNTVFGDPDVVLVNRVTESIQLAPFIPPLTALQGMAPGSMTAQASSLPSPAFGTPSVQFATSHEATSLESMVAFGTPAVRSIHAAESLEPVQFGDVGAPAFAAHAASIQGGVQFGQPLAFTLHALPDWYAGLRFGAVAVHGTGVFPVLDGIQLGEFGQSDAGSTKHRAMPLHLTPQFGPITISRGAMTC